MTKDEEFDYFALGMPVPVDVYATLADLIGKAWPGAMLITDPEAAGAPREVWARWGGAYGPQCQIVKVPRARGKRVSKKDAQAIAEEHAREAELDETRVNFHGISANDEGNPVVSFSGAEEVQHFLGSMGLKLLDDTEGALNYLEWTIIDKKSGKRALMTVARSKAQTPHALRARAEEKITRALALMDARVAAQHDEFGSLVEDLRAILA